MRRIDSVLEELAERYARDLFNEIGDGDVHHVAVLPFRPSLRCSWELAELAHDVLQCSVGVHPGVIVAWHACAVGKCVFEGGVGGRPFVLEDEVFAQV